MSRSVLIPMDDSPPSKAALEHALKTYPDAKLTVLYVINTTSSVGYGDLFPVTVQSEYGERRAEQLFEDVEQFATQHDVELETVTERGIPTRTIAEYINQNAFDHVVMGSHCRTGFNRLFLGSVAERVVRRASVPVTIVP